MCTLDLAKENSENESKLCGSNKLRNKLTKTEVNQLSNFLRSKDFLQKRD